MCRADAIIRRAAAHEEFFQHRRFTARHAIETLVTTDIRFLDRPSSPLPLSNPRSARATDVVAT